MEAITQFFHGAFSSFGSADFALLFIIDVSAFVFIFVVSFFVCIFSDAVRACSKKAFFCAVNLFAALTLAIFSCEFTFAQSVCAAALFWCAGYLFYGVLCLFKPKKKLSVIAAAAPVTIRAAHSIAPPEIIAAPAVPSNVRLEHALSVADKLLLKTLGRGDRQELEKIKTALTVLKVKGILSPQEGENLNSMFNSLLKLMAKYEL